MSDKVLLGMVAIGCITALEIVALLTGIDGQLFATVISAISGICGYAIGKKVGGIGETG